MLKKISPRKEDLTSTRFKKKTGEKWVWAASFSLWEKREGEELEEKAHLCLWKEKSE